VGFQDIRVVERRGFGLEQIALYPLFSPEFLEFLRGAMPADRQSELVFSITVTARKPS
jgi:hypothetical protein